MARRPVLKGEPELTPADFERHPVWVNSHIEDEDDPWYDGHTNEDTVRPYKGELPIPATEGIRLVKATATLADGTVLPAYLTPALVPNDMSPCVWLDGRFEYFCLYTPWSWSEDNKARVLGSRTHEQMFPIEFVAEPGLTSGPDRITIPGFPKPQPLGPMPTQKRKGLLHRLFKQV